MSKKQNLQNLPPEKTGDEESDNELEYVENPMKKQPKQISTMPIEKKEAVAPVKKEKQKRNITEEHKQVLRDRLKVAHQRKQELAEERNKEKRAIEAEYNEKKRQKILMEAERLRRVREKELKKMEVAKPKKKPVVLYYDETEDEDEDEEPEEEVIVKQKKKPQPKPVQAKLPLVQQPQPIYQQPVYQQPPFQIKFC